jgi:hypothetical protein
VFLELRSLEFGIMSGLSFWIGIRVQFKLASLSFRPKRHRRADGSVFYTLRDNPRGCWIWEIPRRKDLSFEIAKALKERKRRLEHE